MPSDLEERKVHAFLVLQLADADSPWWTQLLKNIQYHSRQIQDRPLDHQHDLLNGFDYIRSQQTLDDAFTTAFEWVGTLGTWINNSGAPQYCMALLFLSAASSPDLQTQLLKHYCLVADVDSPCLFELPKVKDMSDVYLILTDNGFYKTHRNGKTLYVSFDHLWFRSCDHTMEVQPRFIHQVSFGYVLVDLHGRVFHMDEDFALDLLFEWSTTVDVSEMVENILILSSGEQKYYYDVEDRQEPDQDPIQESETIQDGNMIYLGNVPHVKSSATQFIDVVCSGSVTTDFIQADKWVRVHDDITYWKQLPPLGKVLDWCSAH